MNVKFNIKKGKENKLFQGKSPFLFFLCIESILSVDSLAAELIQVPVLVNVVHNLEYANQLVTSTPTIQYFFFARPIERPKERISITTIISNVQSQ